MRAVWAVDGANMYRYDPSTSTLRPANRTFLAMKRGSISSSGVVVVCCCLEWVGGEVPQEVSTLPGGSGTFGERNSEMISSLTNTN